MLLGVERVQANTLEANADESRFFERFEYVRTDERPVGLGEASRAALLALPVVSRSQ